MNQETVLIDAIIGAIGVTLTPFLARHGIDAEGTKRILNGIAAALTALVGLAAALHARSKVTPLANPKTNDGTPLVPAPAATFGGTVFTQAGTSTPGIQTMKIGAPDPATAAPADDAPPEGHTEP